MLRGNLVFWTPNYTDDKMLKFWLFGTTPRSPRWVLETFWSMNKSQKTAKTTLISHSYFNENIFIRIFFLGWRPLSWLSRSFKGFSNYTPKDGEYISRYVFLFTLKNNDKNVYPLSHDPELSYTIWRCHSAGSLVSGVGLFHLWIVLGIQGWTFNLWITTVSWNPL